MFSMCEDNIWVYPDPESNLKIAYLDAIENATTKETSIVWSVPEHKNICQSVYTKLSMSWAHECVASCHWHCTPKIIVHPNNGHLFLLQHSRRKKMETLHNFED